MRDSSPRPLPRRRGFLTASGLVAAGLAALSMRPRAAVPAELAAAEPAESPAGYRDSERARRYYETTRI